jgi:4-carboxymuconolactone decarboxylase
MPDPAPAVGGVGTFADMTTGRYDEGMAVRREVLGDSYVEQANARITDFTEDFQRIVTEFAWGTIWARPGLDRRTRSVITLTALIARGHHDELALHLRGALRNGLTRDEIKEVLLQAAVYCGVPDANAAFRVAQRVLDEVQGQGDSLSS